LRVPGNISLLRLPPYSPDLNPIECVKLADKIPSGGWHEPGGSIFGPRDGLMYFGQGTIGLNGTVTPTGYMVDIAKHPNIRDVPGQDVKLSGHNVWGRDPRAPFPILNRTGAFKTFGTPGEKGKIVKREKLCCSAVFRSQPDDSDIELLARGVRNPYGLAFSEEGELYASDNDFEETGISKRRVSVPSPMIPTGSGTSATRAAPTARSRRSSAALPTAPSRS